MSSYDSGSGADWQACGVATVGGAYFAGAMLTIFEFRSQQANCRSTFLFIGAGVGYGGDLGGATGISPGNVIHNQQPDLWTDLSGSIGNGPFSADDLNWSYAALCQATVAGALGYSLCTIRAGWARPLFDTTSVNGWVVGVGVVGSMMPGIWKRLGDSSAYY